MSAEFEKTLAAAIHFGVTDWEDHGGPIEPILWAALKPVVADPAEVERLTASHEHVDGLLAASGHPEDRIRFARLHIEPTLKGISRPLALAITERELAQAVRDALRGRLAAVETACKKVLDSNGHAIGCAGYGSLCGCWKMGLRVALAEPTSNEPPSESKLEVGGPDPDGGLDLTDEEFAAFLKAAKG